MKVNYSKWRKLSMNRNIIMFLLLGLVFFVAVGTATAEPKNEQNIYDSQGKDWSIKLGILGLYTPEYEGSNDYEFQGLPSIDITWQDKFFLNTCEGLGAYLWDRNDVKLGVSIGYSFGREENDSSNLDGLGDIDGGATANVLFEWEIDNFSFTTHYEQQFTGEGTGFQIHADMGYLLPIGEKTILIPSVKTTYSSSDYMKEYFSISSSQSAQSGLTVYDAKSGFKTIGFQLMSIHTLSRKWELQTMTGYERLVGDAADSPVVKKENQYLFSVELSYTF